MTPPSNNHKPFWERFGQRSTSEGGADGRRGDRQQRREICEIAEAVAPTWEGRLISTDFSPAMVAAARRRGVERGLRNVEYRVIDAERIELETNSVDVEDSLARFTTERGYELPGVVLCAVGD